MERNLINYGQHYLINNTFYKKLIDTAQLNQNDTVIEIGAGDGRLTKILCKYCKNVISFEVDLRSKSILLSDKPSNVTYYFENYLNNNETFNAYKIVASLPYQITEPFIEKIAFNEIKEANLIVGKKFALSVLNEEQIKSAIFTNCFFDIEYIADISPDNFDPPPKVYSAIIKLKKKGKECLSAYYYIYRELFEQRDKKIKNALKEAFIRYYQFAKNTVLTQKQSKLLVKNYCNDIPLDKYLFNCSNKDYKIITNSINNFVKNVDKFFCI